MRTERPLTPWQRTILDVLWDGLSEKEIAARTGRSVKTIATQKARLRWRFGARTTIELMRKAVRQGVLTA